MTMHFPDEVDTNVLTIDATDPKSRAPPSSRRPRSASTSSKRRPRSSAWTFIPSRRSPARRGASRRRRRPRPGRRRAAPGLREAQARRHLLLPALHAVQARRGVGQPRRARLRLRAAARPARGGLRRRELLRALLDARAAARGRARLRRHRLQGGRRRRALRGPRAPAAAPLDPEPLPRPLRAGPRRDARRRGGGALRARVGTRRPRRASPSALASRHVADPPRTVLPQAGNPGLRLLRRVGRVDPGSLDDYRAHGGYEALRRAIELGPSGDHPRDHRVEARRPRRRRVPHGPQVGGRRARARAAALPRLQRRRVASRAPSRTAC